VRLLCHDGQGRALLRQLGLIKSLAFHDTAVDRDPRTSTWGATLCALALSKGGGVLYAPGDDRPPNGMIGPVPFTQWWARPVLALNPTMNAAMPVHVSTRSDLVLWLANQDGGAHVDEMVDAAYDDTRRARAGTFRGTDGSETMLPTPVAASMRQVAHEMLVTLSEVVGVEPPTPVRPELPDGDDPDGEAYASFTFTIPATPPHQVG